MLVAVVLLALVGWRSETLAAERTVVLATTTSTQDSGLLDDDDGHRPGSWTW